MPTFKHSRELRNSLRLLREGVVHGVMDHDGVPLDKADLDGELWCDPQWSADMIETGFWLPAYADD